MTPDQMAELAARLWELRKAYLGTFSEHNEADIRLSADLDSAANLIAGMAQQSSRHVALVCPQCNWTLDRREPLDRQEDAA